MKTGGWIVALAGVVAWLTPVGAQAEDVARRITGHWELVSVAIVGQGDPDYPFGEDAVGEVWYDEQGRFAGQIMRRGRPGFASGDIGEGTPEEIAAAFRGYVAYFGTYEVDESVPEVVHRVRGSLFPNWIGSKQRRRVHFDDEELVLSTPPFPYRGESRSFRAVWRRRHQATGTPAPGFHDTEPGPAVAAGQAAVEPAELRERVRAYQRAWNTHDATAVAAFFSEDADLVLGNLPAIRGLKAIESWWREYFERQEPDRRGTFEVIAARLLEPDVGLVNVATTTGGEDGGAKPLPVRKARGTWLLRRDGNEWRIEAMRGLPTEEDRVELTPTLETAKALRPRIRAFVAAYEDAFNRHDPDTLSALYHDDADIIVRERPIKQGAQAIRDWWRAYFNAPRPYRAMFIIEEIRMLGDDAALLNLVATGVPLESTSELAPARHARATWILVREEGEWLIAALRVLPSESDRMIRASRR